MALVTRVCRELGVELQHCSTAKSALEKLAAQKFHGVIVDDQDAPDAALILSNARASGKRSLTIALAQADAALDAVFGAGTHLVIYKPLTHDRLRNGLRAIRALMGRRQHRGSRRVKANIAATITVNETGTIPAKILDISGGGTALSIQRSLPAVKSLKLSFVLPGGESPIVTAAELVWQDVKGHLGIQFVNISPTSTLMISNWVKAHPAANRIAPSS